MQLKITKINSNHQVASEISATFNSYEDYFNFLEVNGIFIDAEDAIFEYSQGSVEYRLPLEV
jgi:hypothetical protein